MFNQNIINKLPKFTKNPLIQISALALAGGIAAAAYSHNFEVKRDYSIPLGFSEISQIERDIEKKGKNLGVLTPYYAKSNDLTMKVFESWNKSIGKTNPTEAFAREIKLRAQGEETFRYTLQGLLGEVPKLADDMIKLMKEYAIVQAEVRQINSLINNSWKEKHEDYYRTEVYTDIETYTCGNSICTKLVTKTRQVYDHTIHTYTYFPENANKASELLNTLVSKGVNLKLEDRIFRPSTTNESGRKAAFESRKIEDIKESDLNYNEIASKWVQASIFSNQYHQMLGSSMELKSHAEKLNSAKTTAKSVKYKTKSSRDAGPVEFQISKQALNNGNVFSDSVEELFDSIMKTKGYVKKLNTQIEDMINTYTTKGNGLEKKAEDVLNQAKEIYKTNFKEGFEIQGYRTHMPYLAFLGGALALGLVGIGGLFTKEFFDQKKRENEWKRRY